ncbi:MAG: ester cyclase [SAR202 cluster bacterium]|mgnify:CR=1 FL=1|nr:ester cyclase [SAR202 cluster bacterium]|tara:strand:+ start:840 stop:1256 length:417 start_codon:yes stop_codon:yes gene_type:complete
MSEENKTLVRSFFESFSNGDLDATKAIMADNHIFHFPLADEPMDKENHAGAQSVFKAAIPDLKFEIHDQIAEGDKVVTRFTVTGTFTNEFQGLPPSGEAIEFSGTNIMRIVDGKSVEEWDAFDTMALMGQLGAIHTHH